MRPLSTSVVILWLAAAPLAPASTAAQSESPEAREVASLVFSSGEFEAVFIHAANMGTLAVKGALEGRLRRQLTEDESKRLGEVFHRVLKEGIPKSDYQTLFVDVLARYYSPQELEDLVVFYRTPLGMKVLHFASGTREDMIASMQRMMAGRQREVGERFNAEFAREFPALTRELERKQRP